jgi:hypothetical protein
VVAARIHVTGYDGVRERTGDRDGGAVAVVDKGQQ